MELLALVIMTVGVDREATTLLFFCNICGKPSLTDVRYLNQEAPTCQTCNSNARVRAVIQVLSTELFHENLLLPDFPTRRISEYQSSPCGRPCPRYLVAGAVGFPLFSAKTKSVLEIRQSTIRIVRFRTPYQTKCHVVNEAQPKKPTARQAPSQV